MWLWGSWLLFLLSLLLRDHRGFVWIRRWQGALLLACLVLSTLWFGRFRGDGSSRKCCLLLRWNSYCLRVQHTVQLHDNHIHSHTCIMHEYIVHPHNHTHARAHTYIHTHTLISVIHTRWDIPLYMHICIGIDVYTCVWVPVCARTYTHTHMGACAHTQPPHPLPRPHTHLRILTHEHSHDAHLSRYVPITIRTQQANDRFLNRLTWLQIEFVSVSCCQSLKQIWSLHFTCNSHNHATYLSLQINCIKVQLSFVLQLLTNMVIARSPTSVI